ncbi:hypothetical protein B0H13DRAFT_2316252 [Mycena leptocephala]|nr:hypothetical protein B0H13DRAFT_2316252 [Mycena leptocephala]
MVSARPIAPSFGVRNADAFLGWQYAIATHSLLDPRQDAGAPPARRPPPPLRAPQCHRTKSTPPRSRAASFIAITMWCMRERFRLRSERMEEKQPELPVVVPDPAPPPPLPPFRPPPPAVQAAMWKKASSAASLPSSSPRAPQNEPDIDVAAQLWDDPHGSPRSRLWFSPDVLEVPVTQSSGTRHSSTMSVASGGGGGGSAREVPPDPATQNAIGHQVF